MPLSPEERRPEADFNIRDFEAEVARERMAEILDSVYQRHTPLGEGEYFLALKELYELYSDFPDEYNSLFFLRSVRSLRIQMKEKR